ncbi:MAG: arsenate reductase ArsC [Candidatus Tantalella remota]|nr:arsenate reductase ArsC [Candidatus Tantalella remota]
MDKIKVLFVCVHNSARSQIAEAFLNGIAGDKFAAESAGLEPGTLNPVVVEVMLEEGVDISGNVTKSVAAMLEEGRTFDFIVAVCDGANAERCPVFPGSREKIHWEFDDPSAVTGTDDEKEEKVKIIRDQIKNKVEAWGREVVEETEGS